MKSFNYFSFFRNLASGLLNKTTDANKSENDKSIADDDVDDDSHYVNSYSNYNIHLEMLQVGDFCLK